MNPTEARAVLADELEEIAPEVDLDDVDPDARLRDELDLDSLDFLNLVERLHTRTGVDIPESDYRRVDTVNAFVEYLVQRTTTAAASR